VRGHGDVLAAKYYLQAAALAGFSRSAVIEGAAAAEAELLRSTLWVIQGVDDNGKEICQGTAFQLRSVGFVTAQHVVAEPPFPVAVWRLVRGEAPFDEHVISGYRSIPDVDLAILDTGAFSRGQLLLGNGSPPAVGDDVLAAGFPNWHSYGDTPIHSPTEIIQLKPISGVTHISVGTQLVSGASGGPLLDSAGRVIGVIVKNKNDETMPNGVIDLSRLADVASATSIPLA
jgi:S1-C subfamily serine protease